MSTPADARAGLRDRGTGTGFPEGRSSGGGADRFAEAPGALYGRSLARRSRSPSIHLAGLMGGATLDATLAQVLLGPPVSAHWEAVTQDSSPFALVGVLQLGLVVVLVGYGDWFLWRFSRTR